MTDNKSAPQPKKKLKLYVGVAALISIAAYFQMTMGADIPEITGQPIPYNHLSSEKTEPYLDKGEAPVNKADIRAAKKWPDVRSCLVRSERNKDIPDLRKINWRKMRMDTDIEVCMFRIFASLGTPEKAKLWFEAQGFNLYVANLNNQYVKTWVSVQANYKSAKLEGSFVPSSGIGSILYGLFSYSENFSGGWDKNGKLISTWHRFTTI